MTLHPPLCITPSLLPGVRIGDAHETAWVQIDKPRAGESGLVIVVTLPDGTDVRADRFNPNGGTIEQAMGDALGDLGASGESYASRMRRNDPEIDPDSNEGLFPAPVPEWAYEFSDELAMVQFEIEEPADA